MFRFKCTSCDEWHEGMPALGAQARSITIPFRIVSATSAASWKPTSASSTGSFSSCAAVWKFRCAAIPSRSATAWVSLSKPSFDQFVAHYDAPVRSHIGPFFGWLSASLPLYPNTESLKTRAHLRDNFVRPFIELEPTDHPLAVEQRNGITAERAAEIFAYHMHGPPGAGDAH
jgi:hypothetical protein